MDINRQWYGGTPIVSSLCLRQTAVSNSYHKIVVSYDLLFLPSNWLSLRKQHRYPYFSLSAAAAIKSRLEDHVERFFYLPARVVLVLQNDFDNGAVCFSSVRTFFETIKIQALITCWNWILSKIISFNRFINYYRKSIYNVFQ